MPVVNNLHYNFIMTGRLAEKHTVFSKECFTNLLDVFETLLNVSGILNTRVSTPEVYILLSNDPMCQSSNNCGMLVSIRQDVYESIDQTIVEDVMMKLSQSLKAKKLLHSSRNFYAGSKARAIMDILPFMLEQDTPDMKYVFQSWTPFPLPHT
ncbi:hypothetical protein [Paenibacillus sp. TY11]|uniref:hypothetical protein n=1 Tax=Paenibacillus sp. TY11 TaxID=3448633 RepID=UPI00403937F4